MFWSCWTIPLSRRRPRLRLLGLMLACWMGLGADGQPVAGAVRRVTLSECLEQSLSRNRELQIERINPRLARLTLDADYAAYDPVLTAAGRRKSIADRGGLDPRDLSRDAIYDAESYETDVALTGGLPTGLTYTFAGEYSDTFGVRNGLSFDSYGVAGAVSVSQPLLRNFWIDDVRMMVRVNQRQLRITELGVIYLLMDVVNRVQQAYYELAFAHANVKVQEKLIEARQRFVNDTQQRIAVGALPPLEGRLAQSQLAQVQADLVTAKHAVGLAENELKTLMGDDFKSSTGTTLLPADPLLVIPQTFDFIESSRQGLANRPDLTQLKLDVEKADIVRKYRHNQLFPSLDLVAGYGRRGADVAQAIPPFEASGSASAAFEQFWDGVAPNDVIGLIFSMPLSRKAERADYRASKELQAQAELLVRQREELVLRQVDDALRTTRSAFDRVVATRLAAESAEAAVAAEIEKLNAGKSTFFVVLDLQGQEAEARSEELRARADYCQAISQLHFAEGTILERAGITAEVRRAP